MRKNILAITLAICISVLFSGFFALRSTAADVTQYPNALQMTIEDGGTVSNNLETDIYVLSAPNGQPEIGVDSASGNRYVLFSTEDHALCEVSMKNATQQGFFWDYYFQKIENADKDLSFTWEFLVRLPEMPTEQIDLFGYFTSDTNGGFGLQVNETQGILNLGNANESTTFHGSDATVKFAFDMQANQWYHCILTYNHTAKTASAFVNGEPIQSGGVTAVPINKFIGTHYKWNVIGMCIGTTSESGAAKIVNYNNDIGVYNFSTYSVDANDAELMWQNVAQDWLLVAPPSNSPTHSESATPLPTPGDNTTTVIPPTGANSVVLPTLVLTFAIAIIVLTVYQQKKVYKEEQ